MPPMAASHGWALVSAERKREIIAAICDDTAPRGPLHVELDLTDRCNVACYFCNQQDVRTRQQLPLGRVLELLDEASSPADFARCAYRAAAIRSFTKRFSRYSTPSRRAAW